MSGQRIDDHNFWGGNRTEESVFAKGSKIKMEPSAEGAGSVGRYEDTTEAIKSSQEQSVRKIKSHASKNDYRN